MAGNDALVKRIVEIIKSQVNSKQALTNLSQNQNIAPAIVEIIKRSIPEAPKVVAQAPPDVVIRAIVKAIQNGVKLQPSVAGAAVAPMVQGGAPTAPTVAVMKAASQEDIVRAIVKAIQNGVALQKPIAGAAVAPMVHGGAPAAPTVAVVQAAPFKNVALAILTAIRKRIPVHQNVMNAAAEKKPGFFQRLSNLFRPKNKMPVFGPNVQPNFMNANKNNNGFKPPPPGYVLTTRNGKTGWFRNKGAPALPSGPAGPPTGPIGPTQPRNYSKMTIRELLDALKKYPENRSLIADAIRKAVEKELKNLRYEYSRSRRVRKLGDLLRLLPRNYSGRRNASTMIVNDVRETRNNRELSNLRSNLGSVPNENIRRALENQRRRFENKKRREENERRRTTRRNGGERNVVRRNGGEYAPIRRNVVRRSNESNNEYELRRRRAALENNERRRIASSGAGAGAGAGAGPGPAGYGGGNSGAPPLPINQQRAINNVGGVNKALNTVMNVPGGATEVAKAAEALNETSGNANMAIRIKGASPEAVKAVQNLGGPKNSVVVLEGLNTLSQKHETRKRKAARRIARPKKKKTKGVRVAELNRVLESVKKQRLISLAAHNVTKTHNIHPNDEKLKKYYKKVLKANILRTPFANIVKQAAKKR